MPKTTDGREGVAAPEAGVVRVGAVLEAAAAVPAVAVPADLSRSAERRIIDDRGRNGVERVGYGPQPVREGRS